MTGRLSENILSTARNVCSNDTAESIFDAEEIHQKERCSPGKSFQTLQGPKTASNVSTTWWSIECGLNRVYTRNGQPLIVREMEHSMGFLISPHRFQMGSQFHLMFFNDSECETVWISAFTFLQHTTRYRTFTAQCPEHLTFTRAKWRIFSTLHKPLQHWI